MSFSRLSMIFLLVFLVTGLSRVHSARAESVADSWHYKLGEGLQLSDTSFHLGGYSSLNYLDINGSRGALMAGDLSLFLFGDISDKLRFFSEQEFVDLYMVDMDGKTHGGASFEVERFFVDYAYRDSLKIRFGKFLTPVGTWNEIHVEPLTWTASRPLVTSLSFPEHTTGIGLFGDFMAGDTEFLYNIFLQNNESLNENTGQRQTHTIYGGRIRYLASPALEIGLPLLYYLEYREGERVYLTGLDLAYKKEKLELRLEATVSRVEDRRAAGGRSSGWSDEGGYYIQGVYAATERHFLILRHEWFKARGDEGRLGALSTALAYKPRPQIVIKAEYQARNGRLDSSTKAGAGSLSGFSGNSGRDRFLSSFSILF